MIMNLLCCGRTAEGKREKEEVNQQSRPSFQGLCPVQFLIASSMRGNAWSTSITSMNVIYSPSLHIPSHPPISLYHFQHLPTPPMLPTLSQPQPLPLSTPSHLPWFHPTSSGFSVRNLLTFIDGCHGYVSTTHSLTSVHSS